MLARLNLWIRDLASTNFKIVVGAVLSLATAIFYFGSEIRCRWAAGCRPIDSTNFGLWLAFVAAWAGLAYAQYKTKRETYAAPSPDSERAGVPATPPPAEPAPAAIAVAVPTTVAELAQLKRPTEASD